MNNPGAAKMDFAMIINGVDFLDSAIQHLLIEDDQRELKYGVLHLQAAVEILVKVRLQREGWQHLFVDPYSADENKLKRGDFNSVPLTSALQRLKRLTDLELKAEEQTFKKLNIERNKLQHFGSTSNQDEVRSAAGRALDVLAQFIEAHLVPDCPPDEEEPLAEARAHIERALAEIDAVMKARMDRIEGDLAAWARSGLVITCPACTQMAWTFDRESEDGFCRYCEVKWWEVPGEVIAEKYAVDLLRESSDSAVQGTSSWSVSECPQCRAGALVDAVDNRNSPDVRVELCFECGFAPTAEHSTCGDCGRLTSEPDADVFLCSACRAYRLGKD